MAQAGRLEQEEGCEAVICASTGNTSAAAAAYASRGGLKPYVLIPEGFVAQGKLAQALMYGAEIISINGNFDKALEIVRDLSSEHPVELVNSEIDSTLLITLLKALTSKIKVLVGYPSKNFIRFIFPFPLLIP